MSSGDSSISAAFSIYTFARIANSDPISVYDFVFVMNYLIGAAIPFDISFAPGTRKEASALQLTLHINPSISQVLNITLQSD